MRTPLLQFHFRYKFAELHFFLRTKSQVFRATLKGVRKKVVKLQIKRMCACVFVDQHQLVGGISSRYHEHQARSM